MIWQDFNSMDYAIIGLVVLSAMISLFRGFVREAISLASWVLGVWVALRYAHLLQDYFSRWISSDSVRYGIAFGILLLTTILLGMLINLVLSFWINRSALSIGNRVLGVVFGACRGVALVVIALLLIVNIGNFKEMPLVTTSVLIEKLKPLVGYLQGLLPSGMQALLERPSLVINDKNRG